jgi:hypothetical protein
MLLSKKRHKLVTKVIDTWKNDGVISEEESRKLNGSIEISKFDWKRLAKYSFWIAGITLAISIFALLLDDAIMELLRQLFRLPTMIKAVFLTIIAAALYFWGFTRKQTKPEKKFSNEFILFVGAIITGAAIVFFGMALDTGSKHFTILILMASVVYLLIGGLFPSAPVWVLGLISLGSWFGTETGYVSGWGAYFLGMNYPARFVLFGALIIAASLLLGKSKLMHLSKSTLIMGLLNLFLALWIMSIFGNYGDMTSWHEASITERFIWSLIFGVCAIGSIVWGLKNDDGITRGFGITFLFINLYTKYFEYFWNVSHKAIFFAVLAVSFWVAGRYSEKAYNALKGKLVEVPGDDA